MSKTPYLAPFDRNSPIHLTPMPNGGWVVDQSGGMDMGRMPKPLGAFGNSKDLLAALTDALADNDTVQG